VGGLLAPFRFLIPLRKPFNRKYLGCYGEFGGKKVQADGDFPHLFKACQLLAIVVHETIAYRASAKTLSPSA
jgi:hypothetical protein